MDGFVDILRRYLYDVEKRRGFAGWMMISRVGS